MAEQDRRMAGGPFTRAFSFALGGAIYPSPRDGPVAIAKEL